MATIEEKLFIDAISGEEVDFIRCPKSAEDCDVCGSPGAEWIVGGDTHNPRYCESCLSNEETLADILCLKRKED